MTSFKFIHAADLHIDSPLRGLETYAGAPVERIRGASRQALTALVSLAIQEDVKLVVLAGDIFDGNWADFRTGLFFREQMVRLRRADILVFIVRGNHDAESQITRQLPDVEGVKVFNARRSETVDLPELGVAVHGKSFPTQAVLEDLVPSYPLPVPGRFNIGILHTSLNGREGHNPYTPTTLEVLRNKGYDYFALGHVHAREVVSESSPRVVFPGNLQGRWAKETGSKGCELVTVTDGVIAAADHVSLEAVRWHALSVDVSRVETIGALAPLIAGELTALASVARDRLHAVRVTLRGESLLHRMEAEQPGSLLAAVQAAAQDVEGTECWIEDVRLDLRSPFDRRAAADRQDAVGEVVRLVDSIASDDATLQSWYLDQVRDMKEMPSPLGDLAPKSVDLAAMRAYLADAESSVLVPLLALADGSSET